MQRHTFFPISTTSLPTLNRQLQFVISFESDSHLNKIKGLFVLLFFQTCFLLSGSTRNVIENIAILKSLVPTGISLKTIILDVFIT